MCKKLIPFYISLLMTMPVYAVETYKISDYGGGHQIWFEAEDFDERNPDTDQYFPVVDAAGAFGQAITRAGGAGGMIRWTFNIVAAGGKGGTWYFWGRVINPSNQSDFMLVEGHPGEPQIPTAPPFPGTSSAAGFTNEHRVFEENMGPPWEWGRSGHGEAHTKELQGGENTMYILHRQGNDTVFWDVFMWTDSPNYVPTDEDYENAMMGLGVGPASRPDPADGALYADMWASLGWRPGDFAVSHDVYFGDNFDDVNDGTPDSSGFQGNQPLTSTFFVVGFPGFAYPDGLVPGTTYYWRIDEVNDTDPNSPWKGDVWSFWIPPRNAYDSDPPDGAKFVDPNMELSWTAGFDAKLHTVYFGDNFDDVNNAVVGLPLGTTTYTPGTLELDKDYYWRVDEFDGIATHKGDVWSFKTLPDIPITDPNLIGWWKFDVGSGSTSIDWSGYGNDGKLGGNPQWVDGIMDGALDLRGSDYVTIDGVVDDITSNDITLSAWIKTTQGGEGNVFASNDSSSGHVLLFGIDNGNVYVDDGPSTDWLPAVNDDQWHMITLVMNGPRIYLYTDGIRVATISTSIDITTETRWSIGQEWDDSSPSDFYVGMVDDARFYNVALTPDEVKQIMRGDLSLAWDPKPGNGLTPDLEDATPLSWSPGDNASEHDVYFGTDRGAVADADESDTTGVYRGRQIGTSYTPPEVEWGGGPYYWRIDENNTDGTISTGSVWSFTVADFLVVDDMEAYNDLEPDDPESNRIFNTWIDGWEIPTNGSIIGYADPPFTEQTNVHGGKQSMPYFYDKHSEAELPISPAQDWTKHGATVLSLYFHGDPGNTVSQIYVKVNNTKVVYSGNAFDIVQLWWKAWIIPLEEFTNQGANLRNVTKFVIGFGDEANIAAGGSGVVLFDDIRLLRTAPEPPEEIWLEAEAADSITAPMNVYNDPAASGGRYIGTDIGIGNESDTPPADGIATYSFTVAGGTYKILGRVIIPDGDSFWVRIPGATNLTPGEDPDNPGTGWVRWSDPPDGDDWHWEEVFSGDHGGETANWTLPAGTYTLEIARREDGALLDAIVITDDVD